jgi:hypothetical protein
MAHKAGEISDEDYTERYIGMMRYTYHFRKERWLEVLANERLAIACYCTPGKFCHRHLLADYLVKVGQRNGILVTFNGELTSV